MSKICLCVPTRNRPINMFRMFNSFIEKADNPEDIEVIFYIDEDDENSLFGLKKMEKRYNKDKVRAIIGPRIVLSQTHTECFKVSNADIACYTGDDVVVETQGFDTEIKIQFNKYQDKIILVSPQDGYNDNVATTGFIHRNWFEVTGYVTPPQFGADWSDTFLTDVAKSIDRFIRISAMIRHYHPAAMPDIPIDLTMAEKIMRGNAFGNGALYYSSEIQDCVKSDIAKLRNFIKDFK